MPRLTEATAAKRRLHILNAAARCLFERGLLATSVDDVCAVAGISKGAFYSHFPSKEALIHAVTDMLSAELGPLDDSSVAGLAESIFSRQIAPALPPSNARFGIEITAASAGDSGLRDRNTANLERLRHAVEAAVCSLIAAGHARADADAEAIGWIVQAHVMGVLCRNAVWPAQDEAALARATHLLLDSLLAPA
ncbi:TetR/AcrR family transcriptional regulator [Sphingomonas sp. HITSZ_GF]|uniref:TetR/AcrR family transcriptional regulator n=1 Tax=Sphingomonas sp. HITSZ_GF TaxID=3037247 RepID=UPI00240CE693|nr:TetR/AcrR family transcriptional regulator [Sphingomonas sp. HITSZ_GF]MDG2532347.1 TetR/AcrR family transcriptional regulator [Sphingomonas sp. HITSZ_GF]